jgi:hypothetical protein
MDAVAERTETMTTITTLTPTDAAYALALETWPVADDDDDDAI